MQQLQKMVCYRNRAGLLREMADDFKDDEHRRMLYRIADDYDQMAAALEEEVKGATIKRV